MNSRSYQIVVLPGDGIGSEVTEDACQLLDLVSEKFGLSVSYEMIPCGGNFCLHDGKRDWPEGSEEKCKQADAILLGAVGWPASDGSGPVTMSDGKMAGYSAVIGNRMNLDLFANIRPVKCYPGILHNISGEAKPVWKPENVDMVIIRENTEDLYCGMGGLLTTGGVTHAATDTRIITRAASERVIRCAFELSKSRKKGAPKDKKKRVTAIVKNNVLDGCRLFTQIFREVARDYPDIEPELAIVDAFTQWLITRPEHYDVCVTTNLFGDIVTDLASVLQGGMGMAVGCNVGTNHAMFEPIHGSAPPLAGTDKANPMAMHLACGEMLKWLSQKYSDTQLMKAAAAIENAVISIVADGAPLTEDLVGSSKASTRSAVTKEVCRRAVL